MSERNAGLIADVLFVAVTRPPMRWGVTYSALLFNAVFTLEVFLLTKNLLTLLMAVPMGLMGGLANGAFYDLAVRSCPPGLQGTFMMLVLALIALGFRGSDLLGSWIYASSPAHGFQYCIAAMIGVYTRPELFPVKSP